MLSGVASLLLAASAVVSAQSSYSSPGSYSQSPFPPFSGDPFKKYTLNAKGIKASFIPYGATLTNLWVKDKNGKLQDVAVGYDDGKQYLHDSETNHTYFGAVVGRYANR
jgi:aldose 1-epimerase